MLFLITYDLNRPGQNYPELFEAIKSLGVWWHHLDSTWLVDVNMSAEQICQRLIPHIDQNDRLLVIKVAQERQGWLSQDAWNWIRTHITSNPL